MLFLLRQIRRKLLSSNQVGTYLLYAIGEIFLVVVGILIAVQIDDWSQEQNKKEMGLAFRKQLVSDIEDDTLNINRRINFFNQVYGYGEKALDHIDEPKSIDKKTQWEFVLYLFHASQVWPFTASPSTYTEIQNAGLFKYIGSSAFTNKLSYYYIDGPIQLEQLNGGTQAYRDLVRGKMDIKVQNFIFENCFLGGALVDNLSFQACEYPQELEAQVTQAYHFFKVNDSLEPLLTRYLSTIMVRNSVYANILGRANDLFIELENKD